MKTIGIIAEYNPFHTGHAYHIQKAKELSGADRVIVAMSGDFVQRGEPAIFSKYVRAQAALKNGADLVLQLPVRVSTASAEGFARGGVALLSRLGCTDYLSFGAETENTALLSDIAQILNEEPDLYRMQLQEFLRTGISFPAARQKAVLACLPEADRSNAASVLQTPNNILAVEYLRALDQNSMVPLPVVRCGASYHDDQLPEQGDPASASAIRKAVSDNDLSWKKHVPDVDLYGNSIPVFPTDTDMITGYALLKAASEGSLSDYLDISDDLANRMVNHLEDYTGFADYCAKLKNKSTTYAHISRALLHILLDLKERITDPAPYAHVLGFRKSADDLLSLIKEKGSIPLITSPARAKSILSDEDFETFWEDIHAAHIYRLLYSQKTGIPMGSEYREPVRIL